jgi:hypothetical protein
MESFIQVLDEILSPPQRATSNVTQNIRWLQPFAHHEMILEKPRFFPEPADVGAMTKLVNSVQAQLFLGG